MKKLLVVVLLCAATILVLGQVGAAQGVAGIIQSITTKHDAAGTTSVGVEIQLPDNTIQTVWLDVAKAAELNLLTPAGDVDESKLGQPFGMDGVSAGAAIPTPWGAPILASPSSGVVLYHYPRATTLAWRPVTGATSYLVERAYKSGTTWTAYPSVTVTGIYNTSYTFDFVGDQSGRWRVTAYAGTTPSIPSSWRTFSYLTRPQMPTPTLVSPANNVIFDNYPRWLTLSWKMIPAAAGYRLEIEYCLADMVTCSAPTAIVLSGELTSYYTFQFVGMQPGKWRVTALGGSTYRDSAASGWHWFSFTI